MYDRGENLLGLLLLCVALRQWDTPVERQSWGRLAFDWTLVVLFLSIVLPLRRLGRARSLFFRSAGAQRDELVREVEMAASLQRQLLDQHRPPAGPLDVVARTEPAKVVGGDYYDFVTLPDGRLALHERADEASSCRPPKGRRSRTAGRVAWDWRAYGRGIGVAARRGRAWARASGRSRRREPAR